MKLSDTSRLTTLSAWLVVGLLVLAPFHALLTVWASSLTGRYDLWRLWVEFLMIVVAVPATYIVCTDKKLRARFIHSLLIKAVGAYILLHLILGMWALATHAVNTTAFVYALVINLRLVIIIVLTWIIATKSPWLRTRPHLLLLVPATIVVGFGLLQLTILPADVLRHVGYGAGTIQPYQTIDQKEAYVRVQSTLRGSNPLGSYLVVIVVAALAFARQTSRRSRVAGVILGLAALLVLGGTYSRSAYLGALAAGYTAIFVVCRSAKVRQLLLIAAAVVIVGGIGLFGALRNNDRFQNIFFHTDEHSTSQVSSNHDRAAALQQAAHEVLREPVGRGPGTAGPASEHNNHPPRIAENYFLQLGQEVGWLGLALFGLINVLVLRALWHQREHTLAVTLLASWVGITIVAMLSHAWTDDTLSIVWWGLAGIALAAPKAEKSTS